VFVRNDATGEQYRIYGHAVDQWRSRIGSELPDMVEALRQAIPYGGQLQGRAGDGSILLKFGDAVFAINRDPNEQLVVRTVLTEAQAQANMQTYLRVPAAVAARKGSYSGESKNDRAERHEQRRRNRRYMPRSVERDRPRPRFSPLDDQDAA